MLNSPMTRPTAKTSILVGLLGESPNDTASLEALLGRRHGARLRFVSISPGITGSQLDNPKLQKIVHNNYRIVNPDVVVISRDLDAPATNRAQVLKRNGFFNKMNKSMGKEGVYLLNIEAMEALIAADIGVFNDRYKCVCVVPADPTTIPDPAAFLKKATPPGKPQYDEGHCASLLGQVDYDTVLANCRYFKAFDKKFTTRLLALTAPKGAPASPPA